MSLHPHRPGQGGVLGAGISDDPPGFQHDAVMYGTPGELAAAVAPFIRDALRQSESVSVISTEENNDAIADALDDAAGQVAFRENGDFYDTPARTIASANELREELLASGAPRVRFVGEVPFGAEQEERLDWLRYEAILNKVFASAPQWCVCFYNQRRLPPWLVAGAYRTHPTLLARGGARARSPWFEDPALVSRDLAPPPPSAEGAPLLEMRVTAEELSAARRAVADIARDASASDERALELTVGLNEIMTNAIEHGSDRASVRCWHAEHEVVCEVVDEGPGFDDPFAGYCPPAPSQGGGRGLWLARQTFDRVELERGPGAGLRATLAAKV